MPPTAVLIQVTVSTDALKFGTFTLKSKRISPYLFNAGLFHLRYPLPAYKGIPLASATVDKLADLDVEKYRNIIHSFNRKEAKDHGEGGNIIGAPLAGLRIVIIDDVITAGTTIRETIEINRKEGGKVTMTSRPSAISEVRKQYGIPVLAILTLDDIVEYLKGLRTEDDLKRLEYRNKYKTTD
ncbi:orotate phosphoribosyltransferase [Cenococcum geophilum 1.58]|uniref:orotate phosphoribosyltransferase n=1 Tax=Cenococcum geophilum 1.58 TaxID=794803 RepID=UPI00358EBF51|nr:orotate phosphoribosyltransferase [Cenococcum geophilum 1.58]